MERGCGVFLSSQGPGQGREVPGNYSLEMRSPPQGLPLPRRKIPEAPANLAFF